VSLSEARTPRIGITLGDPAGIGPEISATAVADPRVRAACDPVLYGPPDLSAFPPGRLSADAGRAAYDAIVRAVADALAGRTSAVVTCPVNKEAFALAGLPWRGHTDLLAHLTGADFVAMMFYSPHLMVVLATVHVALREVPGLLTRALVERVVRLAARELPRFLPPRGDQMAALRLAVAGLNPHAGEHGLMGEEDERVLRPAIEALAAEGLDVRGPFPADTVFVRAMHGEFDAVVACYHDQGLIPIKMAAFGAAVNVTLGLPIIRTAVDHGTAFDIAGKGVADAGSLIEAILRAARLAGRQGGWGRQGESIDVPAGPSSRPPGRRARR
jgi:4-hydroxythreonine-4-phosphate dehydrogenase